jgi:hypothetical protein
MQFFKRRTMPLSQPTSPRALKHRRAIQIDAFARDGGLWDIEARISDVKTRDALSSFDPRSAGSGQILSALGGRTGSTIRTQ